MEDGVNIDWLEYKTLRQYKSMGDEFEMAGESEYSNRDYTTNGYNWLTMDKEDF